MARLNAEQTAFLVGELFIRTKKTRARLSGSTIKKLANRTQLRFNFINELKVHLEINGIVLCELARGGYGLLAMHALEGAPTLGPDKTNPTVDEARAIVEAWIENNEGVEDEDD